MNNKAPLTQQKVIANIIFHGDKADVTDYCKFARSYYSANYDPDKFDSYDLWSALKNIGDEGNSPHVVAPLSCERHMYSGIGLLDPDDMVGGFVDWLQERLWFKPDHAVPWKHVKEVLDAFGNPHSATLDNFSGERLYSYWARLLAIIAQEVLYPIGWCVLYCEWEDGSFITETDLPGSVAIVERRESDTVTRLLNSFAESMCDENFYGHAWALWKAGPARQLVARIERDAGPEEERVVKQGEWRKLRRKLRALMVDTVAA